MIRPPSDVARIFLRKPDAPFSTVTIESTGEQERIWTSFGTKDWSEQIDLDVTSAQTRDLITDWLRAFAAHGVRIVRLDAVGYVIKKAGTSCFMVEPEIYAFLDWIVGVADSLGLVLLPEVHDQYATHEASPRTATGPTTSCFPACCSTPSRQDRRRGSDSTSHGRPSGSSRCSTVTTASRCARTSTASSSQDEMLDLADLVQRRGGNVNRILSEAHADGEVDVHQLNCTYYAALDCDDDRYVAARAIQLFARGVPQIYYVGLAGRRERPCRGGRVRVKVGPSIATTTRLGRSGSPGARGGPDGSSSWSGCGAPIRPFAERST